MRMTPAPPWSRSSARRIWGNHEALFQGLYAQGCWDWGTPYPVIRISFGGGVVQAPEQLERKIREQLRINQDALGLRCTEPEGEYSAICGHTEGDLDAVFAPELDGLDCAEILRW